MNTPTDEQRLRMLCQKRDEAIAYKDKCVQAVANQVEQIARAKRTASAQAPKRVVMGHRIVRLTDEQIRNEQEKARREYFREQELQAQLRNVMAKWQDPEDFEPDLRATFGMPRS
jgi:hypothetical protein